MKSADLLYEELCVKLLGEAPISDVSVSSKIYPEVPVWHPPEGDLYKDTRADLRLMGNPRYLERLSAETARNIPFNFKLILIDQRPHELFQHIYKIKSSDMLDITELAKLAWPPTRDVITLVFGPSGEPMKLSANKKGAWLIGHKIGHALFDAVNSRGRENAAIYDSIEREITHYFLEYRKKFSPEEQKYPRDMQFRMFAKAISKFDSAHYGTVLSNEEYIYELVAQYVMFGKVTFHYNAAYANPGFASQEEASSAADTITKMIIVAFRNAVGKTLVDVGL